MLADHKGGRRWQENQTNFIVRNRLMRLTACLVLISVILFSPCVVVLAQEGTLVVANRSGGSVSLIDLETRVEVARLPVGPIIPHEVAVSPDGRLAMTAEYGPNDSPGRHVILIDIPNARIMGRIDLGPNSRPHAALFHPDGQHALATMQDSDEIALIDLNRMEVVRTYPTGGREGHMLRLRPDGLHAYVTSRGGEGTLSVIFLEEDRPPLVIPTGTGAEGISVTSDGGEVWGCEPRGGDDLRHRHCVAAGCGDRRLATLRRPRRHRSWRTRNCAQRWRRRSARSPISTPLRCGDTRHAGRGAVARRHTSGR